MAKKGRALDKLTPILLLVSIALAFAVGNLWERVKSLEKGTSNLVGAPVQSPGTGSGTQAQGPGQGKLSEEQVKKIPEVSSYILEGEGGDRSQGAQVSTDDHTRGSKSAEVFLIEYSDLECPFCARFHPTAQKVLEEYGDQVAWVYRHFPLDQLHPKARPAAEASECVAELGGEEKFWGFVDKIFEDQTRLSDLASIATSVGINQSAFQSCLDSGKYKDKVESHYQGGIDSGITGTPGNIVVNSKGEAWLIPGALPFESVKTVIDEALSS